ncbi:homocysteine S-methyltransferase family protein [uncultured Megasphaera sp.]|uniref:homocysteine S-methyltransferase family protein n=1 Tax=uncultured Megasphaera sp. TaxID=165188 RepID=UPI00259B3B54|nr:homocysteine S-methyltransferase family protein [uncultured Megasphaera sp.]
MKRDEFHAWLKEGILFLDGATGTNLQAAGMPVGVCPEAWILENKQTIIALQQQFVQAGTDILYAPTFTGNRIKLAEYGLEDKIVEINTQLVSFSKEAAQGKAKVAGDMTMTGQQLYPLGELTFEELVDVYREQAQILYDAGVDLFVVETMMSLQETRACVLAIRECCDLPIMASLTFEADGRTLYGTPPEVAVVVLQAMGVDAVGLNCSTGPEDMVEIVKTMHAYASIPILAKPNAGLPELEQGHTVYKTTPEVFAEAGTALVHAGARIIGGCCGTTPEHIKALKEAMKHLSPLPYKAEHRRIVTSERKIQEIDLHGSFCVIGERINPTGKKKLQEELRAGSLRLVRTMAREQEERGAAILDINMGTNGIDEKDMMVRAIYEVTSVTGLPLCIDSSYPEVLEAALRIYPGRALINSISLETDKIKQVLPLAKKYGAMFIALPVSDEGIPQTIEEKHAIIEQIVEKAKEFHLTEADIVVDGLVATAGATPTAALDCLATFTYCKKRNLATVCGLSNISFGLPQRTYVNMTFLAMAISGGLNLAIANPSQDMLMNVAAAANMLMHRPESDIAYIKQIQLFEKHLAEEKTMIKRTQITNTTSTLESAPKKENENKVYRAVLEGEKDEIVSFAQEELNKGMKPEDIINHLLIPAINEVGELYNKQLYFLPQLIASANTMEQAISFLEPQIKRASNKMAMPTIVIATVEGDVHDIGKNLVGLMLRNYGYHVIDLGKDVPAETILDTALKEHAAIIGLSALMTTTMMRMKDVVLLAKEKAYTGKIIIGGAAVTPSFAEEIGADGYSKDAADCVKLVNTLLA